MAYESPSFYGTFPATTGLNQYQFVALSTNGVLINPALGFSDPIGVLVSSGSTGSTWGGSTASGPLHTVQFYGIAKVLTATTTITPGMRISSITTGAEAGWATDASSNVALWVAGIAVQEALSTGGDSTGGIGTEIISVLLTLSGRGTTAA